MRGQLAIYTALFATIVTVPIVLFGLLFGSCEVRRRSDKAACRKGDVEACLSVAQFYEEKDDALMTEFMHYSEEATEHYKLACALSSPEACAKYVTRAYDAPVADRITALTTACDHSLGDACLTLADLFAGGDEVPKDDPRALPLYVKSCASKNGPACRMVGYFHRRGRGGLPKDDAAAAPFFKQGCDLGDSQSCEAAVPAEAPPTEAAPPTH